MLKKTVQVYSLGVGYIWLANYRHGNSDLSCFLDPNYSYWHTSASAYNPKLNGRNTWIRTHEQDDCAFQDERCVVAVQGEGFIGDNGCEKNFPVLCQITSMQYFLKKFSGFRNFLKNQILNFQKIFKNFSQIPVKITHSSQKFV